METETQANAEQVERAQDPVELRMRNVLDFGKFSFELEEKREQSILNQAGQMLTAFSLFSAAILMAYPLVADYTGIPDIQAFCLAMIVLVPLIASLVLAILAQWRFKYQTMKNAEEFENELYRSRNDYNNQSDYDWQWVYQLTDVQKSKKKNNDKRVKLVKASMVCFLTSVGILIVGNTFFFILYV